MNIVEFLGLPAEHAQEIIENASAHLQSRALSLLRQQGFKNPDVKKLQGEEFIHETFRQMLIDAATHGLRAKNRKVSDDQVDEYVKTKFAKK